MIPGSLLKTLLTRVRILRTTDGREAGRENLTFYAAFEEGRRVVKTVNGEDVESSHAVIGAADLDLIEGDRLFQGEPSSGIKPRMFTIIAVEKLRWPSSGIVHHVEAYVR